MRWEPCTDTSAMRTQTDIHLEYSREVIFQVGKLIPENEVNLKP